MRLNFYEDPGHGWLAVPLPLLEQLLPGDGAEGSGFVLDLEDPIVDGCLLTHGGSCRHRPLVYGDAP